MVAHISRFLPAVSQAHARIAAGDIGEPRMVLAERLVDGYPNSGWPLDPAEGSAFLDWGSHGCDLMRWLVGAEPELAFGRTATYRGTAPTALSAMATFGFEGGRMGQVWQSYEMAGPGVLARARYVVVGSEGTLDCHAYGQLGLDRDGAHTIVYRADDFPGPGGAADMDGTTFRTAFRDQLKGFTDAIAAGGTPPGHRAGRAHRRGDGARRGVVGGHGSGGHGRPVGSPRLRGGQRRPASARRGRSSSPTRMPLRVRTTQRHAPGEQREAAPPDDGHRQQHAHGQQPASITQAPPRR